MSGCDGARQDRALMHWKLRVLTVERFTGLFSFFLYHESVY